MAADCNPVKRGPAHWEDRTVASRSGMHEQNLSQPGITVGELIAAVGNLKVPGGWFADALEPAQAAQGLAEMPEWPD